MSETVVQDPTKLPTFKTMRDIEAQINRLRDLGDRAGNRIYNRATVAKDIRDLTQKILTNFRKFQMEAGDEMREGETKMLDDWLAQEEAWNEERWQLQCEIARLKGEKEPEHPSAHVLPIDIR